jgi:hypothetical protein
MKLLENIIEISRYSASTINLQNIRYVLVNDLNKCNKIFNVTNLPTTHKIDKDEQPKAYIVVCSKDSFVSSMHYFNMGITYQNIRLAINHYGYQDVCIRSVDAKEASNIIKLDSEYKVDYVIGIGKAIDEIKVVDTINEENTSYYLDDSNIRHVPKLTKEKLIIKKIS